MFDFEKLEIYQKAKVFNSNVRLFIQKARLDSTTNDQLRRASFSIVLNIAEVSGRFSNADRKHFYTIARSSLFECIAIFDVLRDEKIMPKEDFLYFYSNGEEISKILFVMIKKLSV